MRTYIAQRYSGEGAEKGSPQYSSERGENIPKGVSATLAIDSVSEVEVFFHYGESFVYRKLTPDEMEKSNHV